MSTGSYSNIVALPRPVSTDSVSVVIDGWNALLGASDGFGYSRRPLSTFTLDLPRLADELAARRNRPSRVERIGIILGMHDRRANPAAHAAQAAAGRHWARDPRVQLINPGMAPVVVGAPGDLADGAGVADAVVVPMPRFREERGDAAVQQLLTEWTDDRRTGAAILVSADADHLETVTDIRRRRRTHLEVARWEWQASKLWQRGLWVHHLEHDLLDSVTSDRDPRKAA